MHNSISVQDSPPKNNIQIREGLILIGYCCEGWNLSIALIQDELVIGICQNPECPNGGDTYPGVIGTTKDSIFDWLVTSGYSWGDAPGGAA